MKWVLSRFHTESKIRKRWKLIVHASMVCVSACYNAIGINIHLPNFSDSSPADIKNDLVAFMRVPWKIAYFNLMHDDGVNNVLDSNGKPITEQTFKEWMKLNHPSFETDAESKKPSAFLAQYPTWGASNYPTDMFTVLFEDWHGRAIPITESIGTNKVIHISKSVTLSFTPTLILKSFNDEKPDKMIPMGREIDSKWETTYGLIDESTDKHGIGWTGAHKFSVWSEMDGFDAAVESMSKGLSLMGKTGMVIPFNMLSVPDNSVGYDTLDASVSLKMNIVGLMRDSRRTNCKLDIDPKQDVSILNIRSIDFSRYTDLDTHVTYNSCIASHPSVLPKKTVHLPSIIEDAVTTLLNAMGKISIYYHSRPKVHDQTATTKEVADMTDSFSNMRILINSRNNMYHEQSEGFLQLLDGVSNIGVLRNKLAENNLISPNESTEIKTQVATIDISALIAAAHHVGIYKDTYPLAKRPMHIYEIARMGKIRDKNERLIERQRHPTMPRWAEVTLVMLAVFVVTMTIVVVIVAKKLKSPI